MNRRQPDAIPRVIRVVAADDHAAYLRATTETLERAGMERRRSLE